MLEQELIHRRYFPTPQDPEILQEETRASLRLQDLSKGLSHWEGKAELGVKIHPLMLQDGALTTKAQTGREAST